MERTDPRLLTPFHSTPSSVFEVALTLDSQKVVKQGGRTDSFLRSVAAKRMLHDML
jgi:hypothetical protein